MRRQAQSGCGTTAFVMVVAGFACVALCCGGSAWLGFQEIEAARDDLQRADKLYSSGNKSEAVAIYEDRYEVVAPSRKASVLERIIAQKIDDGQSDEADDWSDKFVSSGLKTKPKNLQVAERIAAAKSREQEREAADKQRLEAQLAATEKEEADAGATVSRRGISVAIGENGVLHIPGQDKVLLATDSEAHDRLIALSVAGDKTGIAKMVLAGRAFMVPSGTGVLVIERGGFDVREVRILDGEMENESGFVNAEFIYPK